MHECDLGRVAHAGEHALAEERTVERDAIEAAGELAAVPDFDGVAVAFVEQFAVK